MRWKCSLLTGEERQEHQDWIDQRALEREQEMKQPWKAMQDEDEDRLATENKYIQRYVRFSPLPITRRLTKAFSCIDALPTTIDRALQQIECSTGMKAILVIGGPTPIADGDVSTHW